MAPPSKSVAASTVGSATQIKSQFSKLQILRYPRYEDLHEILSVYAHEIGGAELSGMMLDDEVEIPQLQQLLLNLDEFHTATLYLQREDLTLQEVRALFDEIMAAFPDEEDMHKYLAASGTSVPFSDFTSGVALVQAGAYSELTLNQLRAIDNLRCIHTPDDAPEVTTELMPLEEATLSEVQKAWLRQKRARGSDNYKKLFGDLSCVLPTSNIVERLFSRTKLTLRDRRQRMSVNMLERITLLRYNRHLWESAWLRADIDDDTEVMSEQGVDMGEFDLFDEEDEENEGVSHDDIEEESQDGDML